MKKMYKCFSDIILYSILFLYIIILAKILLFKYISPFNLFSSDRVFSRTLNIIPFKSIVEYFFSSFSLKVALMNVVGNIVIFIPISIYLRLFIKNKNIIKSIAFIFFISLGVEVIQFIFGIGGSDIDDVILNILGGLIGIFIYRLITIAFKNEKKIKSVIAVSSCIIGVLSLISIIQYYPQILGIEKKYELVIIGEELAVDDNDPDVMGQFISFSDGILTVRNITGINDRQDKYGDIEIAVEVAPDIKMARKAIDFHYSDNETLVTYSSFTYEEFNYLGENDSVYFNIFIENGKWKAKDICVVYAKDVNN